MSDARICSEVPRFAFVVSRFPKLTETFIVRELDALRELGLPIELFTIVHEGRRHEPVVQVEAAAWDREVHVARPLALATIAAQAHWLRRRPGAYLRAWWHALHGNRSSWRFLLRALVVVPLAARFACEMQRLRIDRVHAHWASHPTLAALVVEMLTGIPYSFTGHAHDLYADRTMLGEKIAGARVVVVCSADNRALIAELYGPAAAAKAVVVHHGIDLREFEPARLPAPGPVLRLVCVGSLQDYKGHRHLLDACRLLADRGVAFRLVVVGDGDQRAALQAQAHRLALTAAVDLVGRRTLDEVRAHIVAADLVVLPSVVTATGKRDGIPNVLVEAMALGRPVVASDLPGTRELLAATGAGVLLPAGDPVALADALEELGGAPGRRAEMARAGRRVVEERFDIRRTSQRLFDVLVGADPLDTAAAGGVPDGGGG